MKLLEVEKLNIKFNILDGVVNAVNEVSFEINKGEVLGVVGESGSGKSVTFLSLFGLIPQPPGEIVSGKAIYKSENLLDMNKKKLLKLRAEEIGFIYQDPLTSLNPVLRIISQIIESPVLNRKLTKAEAISEAKILLKRVGISDVENNYNSYPHQFSGGMRQRAMIAMAIANKPNILIADEPTTALDVTIQAQILEVMANLSKEFGTAVIVITHNLGVVARYADNVNVMYAGKVIERASAANLYETPHHPYTVGLLNSVPRLDQGRDEKLIPIEGNPPDLANLPPGCSFNPRCDFRVDKCLEEYPEVSSAGNGHTVACWEWENVIKRERSAV